MPFRDVIAKRGHTRLVDLLQRSIQRGTLPPSLIFAGPPGSGKRTTAIAVAQTLNCLTVDVRQSRVDSRQSTVESTVETTVECDACGRCAACTRIARGVHPDVLTIDPGDTGVIRIDQVRDAIDRAAYRPFEGRRRVVIIGDADTLMVAAQNALLKTLEEPPPASIFILLTTRPDMLLATVRSRCIRLWFTANAREEADPGREDALQVAARVLGHAAATNDAAKRLDAAKELLTNTGAGGAGDREQLASHLRAIASMLRDVEVLATRGDERVLAHPDLRARTERLTSVFGGERGVRAFEAVDEALEALNGNAGVKVVADWVALHL
jgi:DNA polymerase-3 subunit delta'